MWPKLQGRWRCWGAGVQVEGAGAGPAARPLHPRRGGARHKGSYAGVRGKKAADSRRGEAPHGGGCKMAVG